VVGPEGVAEQTGGDDGRGCRAPEVLARFGPL